MRYHGKRMEKDGLSEKHFRSFQHFRICMMKHDEAVIFHPFAGWFRCQAELQPRCTLPLLKRGHLVSIFGPSQHHSTCWGDELPALFFWHVLSKYWLKPPGSSRYLTISMWISRFSEKSQVMERGRERGGGGERERERERERVMAFSFIFSSHERFHLGSSVS